MIIKALHLYYFDKIEDRRKRVVIRAAKADSITRLKTKVAEKLDAVRNRAVYYYVVVEIRKADNTPGFRTIVPKTLVA